MNRVRIPVIAALAVCAALPRPGLAQSESINRETVSLSGVLEHYYWVYQEDGRLESGRRAQWVQLRGHIARGVNLVAGTLARPQSGTLDENYAELGGSNLKWRAGRFRAAFGQADWADTWYTGFTRLPLVRVTPFGTGSVMTRLDTGVDARWVSGKDEYTISLLDPRSGPNQLTPKRWDHVAGRFQTMAGSAVLGLNALVAPGGVGRRRTELLDVDWRWSAPQVQVRGELVTGSLSGGHAEGYYLDLYYHPMKLYRTTFITRLDGSQAGLLKSGWQQMLTIGVKQVVSPTFTVSLTHGWVNGSAAKRDAGGWSLGTISYVHF